VDVTGPETKGGGGFIVTKPRPTIPEHVVVIVADPLLPCAVINPAALTDTTLGLSDCQFVQVAVTSRVASLERMPSAMICVVAPACVKDEKAAE